MKHQSWLKRRGNMQGWWPGEEATQQDCCCQVFLYSSFFPGFNLLSQISPSLKRKAFIIQIPTNPGTQPAFPGHNQCSTHSCPVTHCLFPYSELLFWGTQEVISSQSITKGELVSFGIRKAVHSCSLSTHLCHYDCHHPHQAPATSLSWSCEQPADFIHSLENVHCNPRRAHPNNFTCQITLEIHDNLVFGCLAGATVSASCLLHCQAFRSGLAACDSV